MKNGKYSDKSKGRLRRNKELVLFISVLTLVICVIGGTVAYLIDDTDEIKNAFTPGKVDIEITEEIDGDTKNEVRILNKSDSVNAIIRAKVVFTWQKDGVVHPQKPLEGVDYDITWTKDGWDGPDADGWYTYGSVVKPSDSTGILFTGCKPVEGKAPAGYVLVVDVISEAIQTNQSGSSATNW